MRFFPRDLNPFKIQARFKLEFVYEFYNSKFREIWELDQKRYLCQLNLSISMPCLENFGQRRLFIVISKLGYLKSIGKLTGPAQVNSAGPDWTGPAHWPIWFSVARPRSRPGHSDSARGDLSDRARPRRTSRPHHRRGCNATLQCAQSPALCRRPPCHSSFSPWRRYFLPIFPHRNTIAIAICLDLRRCLTPPVRARLKPPISYAVSSPQAAARSGPAIRRHSRLHREPTTIRSSRHRRQAASGPARPRR
jgi:hypothetical protein